MDSPNLKRRLPVRIGDTWFVEGTSIRVADLQADAARAPKQAKIIYQEMGLNSAEYEAARSFDIPPVREPGIVLNRLDVEIGCECGQYLLVQSGANEDVSQRPNVCSCGRIWYLSLDLRPVETQRSGDRRKSSESDRIGIPANGAISIASSIMVRAQQAVDRWNAGSGQTPFAEAMRIESNDLGGTIPALDQHRRAFLATTESIHDGVGHGFSNPGPLLQLIRNLGVEKSKL